MEYVQANILATTRLILLVWESRARYAGEANFPVRRAPGDWSIRLHQFSAMRDNSGVDTPKGRTTMIPANL
jgi:hypothetical protein